MDLHNSIMEIHNSIIDLHNSIKLLLGFVSFGTP